MPRKHDEMTTDRTVTLDKITEDCGLPTRGALAALLPTDGGAHLAEALEPALLEAARDLVGRPSKHFRARLVITGFELAQGEPVVLGSLHAQRLARCAQAVELLHAGSLIVDDIQDGSTTRRGGAAVHERYGVPGALVTGNWLYFWPLRLLRSLELPLAQEAYAYRLYHEALERAHYGQALDLGTQIDQIPRAQVASLCTAVSELKTGSLTGLAMMLGALLAGADAARVAALGDFGVSFGAALQRCDDLGNVLGRLDRTKQFEDLLQRKPSAVWGLAAAHAGDDFYDEFKARVACLPEDGEELASWLLDTGLVASVERLAMQGVGAAFATLAAAWGLSLDDGRLAPLRHLGEELIHAYH